MTNLSKIQSRSKHSVTGPALIEIPAPIRGNPTRFRTFEKENTKKTITFEKIKIQSSGWEQNAQKLSLFNIMFKKKFLIAIELSNSLGKQA